MTVEEGDELGWVVETSGTDELLLATRQGKAIRFSEDEVRLMGLGAAGVLAAKLGDDDAIIGMGVVQDKTFFVLFTDRGYAKRTAVDMFPTQKRYGSGVVAAKLTDESGPLAVAALAREEEQVVLATAKGWVVTLPVKAIHPLGRPTVGYTRRRDTKESYLQPDEHGVPQWLAVLAHTKATTQDASPPTTKQPAAATSESEPPPAKTPARKKKAKEKIPPRSERQTVSPKGETTAQPEDGEPASTQKQPGESKETASEAAGAPTQLPLPIQSPSAKPGRKPKGRKPRTVRSVPKRK
jgi:hypothetical protein